MTIAPPTGHLKAIPAGWRPCLPALILLFFLILTGCFITWPIMISDTDLWYHLSGGRYFWQTGTIARDAFFSYVAPPKSWYNYYWLFQAAVYQLFQWTGYFGLVVLRCLLFALTAWFICLFFIRGRENRTELFAGLSLFVFSTLVLLNRELLVRPHLFSYLFIALFLYILEFRRDRIWLLPLLGILWSNLHGIEFPVMFLIVGAYLAEVYVGQFRGTVSGGAADKKERWLLIAVFYTIFLTPGVIDLVRTPFVVSFETAAQQSLYVAELLPFSFRNLFVFAPVTPRGAITAIQNLIVVAAPAFFLLALFKGIVT